MVGVLITTVETMLWELGFKTFLYLLFQNVIGCFYIKKVRKI